MPDLAYGDREWLERERQALLGHIRAAFRNVSREGGVSWSETFVIDDRGSDSERREARESDSDRHWSELLDDPDWFPFLWSGGLAFIDKIGFRYYLPAAMSWTIVHEEGMYDLGLQLHLALPAPGDNLREHTLDKWSLLDERQRQAVKRFLRYMQARHSAEDEQLGEWWRETYQSYWDTC